MVKEYLKIIQLLGNGGVRSSSRLLKQGGINKDIRFIKFEGKRIVVTDSFIYVALEGCTGEQKTIVLNANGDLVNINYDKK